MVASFSKSELPYLATKDDPPQSFEFDSEMTFSNEGKNTAFIREFHIEWAVGGTSRPVRGYPFDISYMDEPKRQGSELRVHIQSFFQASDRFRERVVAGDHAVYLFGRLTYTDVFGGERATFFCYAFRMSLPGIALWGGRAENYMR